MRMMDRKDDEGNVRPGVVTRARDGQVGEGSKYYYWLKESKIKWIKRWQNRIHEDACAELLVAYAPNPSVVYWDRKWTDEERAEIGDVDVWFDRRMIWLNSQGARNTGLIELDNANEAIYDDRLRDKYSEEKWGKSFNHKLDKLMKLARRYRFFVLIVCHQGGRYASTAGKRANDILALLEHRGLTRGQFMLSTQKRVLADPMGQVWAVPGRGQSFVSLLEV
jgi:hypothetical protein